MDFRTGGITHCNSMREWRVYLDDQKSPIFQDTQAPRETIQQQQRHHTDPNTIQAQLRKALGIHQCFLSFQIWTRLQPQTWRFLRVFRVQCMKYLDNLGVISINNVIRACNHVLWDVLEKTEYVTHSNIIKFNLY
ncbi:AC3 protein [Ageratum yellow vein virus - [G129]]|nr:AC3 protein [Ageratum yellow vein virus - [G129]]